MTRFLVMLALCPLMLATCTNGPVNEIVPDSPEHDTIRVTQVYWTTGTVTLCVDVLTSQVQPWDAVAVARRYDSKEIKMLFQRPADHEQ